MQWSGSRIARTGVLTAVAILLGYIETLIPVLTAIPGFKLGLANLVVVYALYECTTLDALFISVIRVLVIGFIFGNLFGILFGMTGALMSLGMMALAKRVSGLSQIGISMLGGVTHNVAQVLLSIVVVGSVKLVYYLPILMVVGLFTGFFVGILILEIRKRVSGRKIV